MIGRAYRFTQILSIDIVIGVVVLLRFFCGQFQVDPGWQVYALLGGTVWLIYTVDHLRDATSSADSSRARYVFHKKYSKALKVVLVLVLITMLPLLFYIPSVIFIGGVGLATFSFIYLLVQHKLSRVFSKELYVALVYSAGVLMVPMLLSESFSLSTFLLLFLLSFSNLVIFSWYEKVEDEKDGFQSIATQMGDIRLQKIMMSLITLGMAISFLTFDTINVFFLIGFSVYGAIVLFSSRFRRNDLYRTLGDGVFLLPILFEWL